jgi:acyl carrier protein
LDTAQKVIEVLESVLNLNGRTAGFNQDTPLLGAVPELDSMAVISVLTSLEERFGFSIQDDEIDGSTFATVGSLTHLVEQKLRG